MPTGKLHTKYRRVDNMIDKKIYCLPIAKILSLIFWSNLIETITAIVYLWGGLFLINYFINVLQIWNTEDIFIKIFSILAITFFFAFPYALISRYNYIIITDNELIVKNFILPFIKKRYNLKSDHKIRLWIPFPDRFRINRIEFIKPGRRRAFRIYNLDCVPPDKIDEIYETLKSKDIIIEIYKDADYKEYKKITKDKYEPK